MQTGFMQQEEGTMPSITDQLKMQIIKECCEDLISPAEIAVRQNMNVAWIRKIIHDAGRKLPTGYRLTANNGLQLSSNSSNNEQKTNNDNTEDLGPISDALHGLFSRIHFLEQQSIDAISSIRLEMKRINNSLLNSNVRMDELPNQNYLKDAQESSSNNSSVAVRMTLLEQQVRVLQRISSNKFDHNQNFKTESSNKEELNSNTSLDGQNMMLTTSIKSEMNGSDPIKTFPEFCGELQPSLDDPYGENSGALMNNMQTNNMQQANVGHPLGPPPEQMQNPGSNTNIAFDMFNSNNLQDPNQNNGHPEMSPYNQFSQMQQTDMPPGSVLSKINPNMSDMNKALEKDNQNKSLQMVNKVVRQFSCSNCEYKSYQKQDVEQHINDVHRERKLPDGNQTNMAGLDSTNLVGLNQNFGLPGSTSGENELQCSQCDFRADSKIQILLHTSREHHSFLLNTVPMDGLGSGGSDMNQKPFPELNNDPIFGNNQGNANMNQHNMGPLDGLQDERTNIENNMANNGQSMDGMQFLSTPTQQKDNDLQQTANSRSMPNLDFSFDGQGNMVNEGNGASNNTNIAEQNFMQSIDQGVTGYNEAPNTPSSQHVDISTSFMNNIDSTQQSSHMDNSSNSTGEQPSLMNSNQSENPNSQDYQLKSIGAANPSLLNQFGLGGGNLQITTPGNTQVTRLPSGQRIQLIQQPQNSFSLTPNTSTTTSTNVIRIQAPQISPISDTGTPQTQPQQQINIGSLASSAGPSSVITSTANSNLLQQLQGQTNVVRFGDKQIILKRKFPDNNGNNSQPSTTTTNVSNIAQLMQGAQIIQGPNGKKFIILQQKPNAAGGAIRLANPGNVQQIRLPTQLLQQPRPPILIQNGGIQGLTQGTPNITSANNVQSIPTSGNGVQIQIPGLLNQQPK